jgi:hypothetical protein
MAICASGTAGAPQILASRAKPPECSSLCRRFHPVWSFEGSVLYALGTSTRFANRVYLLRVINANSHMDAALPARPSWKMHTS